MRELGTINMNKELGKGTWDIITCGILRWSRVLELWYCRVLILLGFRDFSRKIIKLYGKIIRRMLMKMREKRDKKWTTLDSKKLWNPSTTKSLNFTQQCRVSTSHFHGIFNISLSHSPCKTKTSHGGEAYLKFSWEKRGFGNLLAGYWAKNPTRSAPCPTHSAPLVRSAWVKMHWKSRADA